MAKKYYGIRKGKKTGVLENKTYEEAASYYQMETGVSYNGQVKENYKTEKLPSSDHRNYAFVAVLSIRKQTVTDMADF